MSPVLVFSDDWGRHPSSCQHLVGELLKTGMTATWVNTIGMRPPRLDRITFQRGWEKLRGWGTKGGSVDEPSIPEGLSVIDAKMWPWMSHRWDRWLNRRLLGRQLHDSSHGSLAITTIPIVVDLVDVLPVDRWIYYCVDDFSVWPGLDGLALRGMEDELLRRVDRIVAASDQLAASIVDRGQSPSVLTHGVDLDFWRQSTSESKIAGELRSPLALFWGVVDRRMNAEWVLSLADEMSDGMVALVGPQQDPDPRLNAHSRIFMPGPVGFHELPMLAQKASVLIMPYSDLPVTRAMQPLKLKEYLATLLPVVATDLPAVKPWRDCLDMVSTRDEFLHAVRKQLPSTADSYRPAKVLEKLKTESWEAKAKTLQSIICEGTE